MKSYFAYLVRVCLFVASLTMAACSGCGDGEELAEDEVAFSDVQFEICGNDEDDDGNGLVDCDDRICQRDDACRFSPADPAAMAPATDVTNLSSFWERVRFLVEGDGAVVRGVEISRLNTSNVSVVRGRILDRDGNPIEGVRARIAGAPQYGYTYSRADGWVDFIVNAADERAVIRFQDDEILGVDVEIETESNAFANGRDVVATQLDAVTNVVRGGDPVLTDATPMSDDDGTRTLRAFIQPDTRARVRLADGRVAVLEEFTVRATEYTVGERGPDAMPGELPDESAYTYAVEMSIDEVRDKELDSVEFDRPVSLYVDNFLGFPVGGIVPSGTYDRATSNQWQANENGLIIAVVSGGIDLDGDGAPESRDVLNDIGLTQAEIAAVTRAYDAGTELWRAPITSFSPHDLNWPTRFPEDAEPLDPDDIPDFPPDPEEDPCLQSGSYIECENRVLSQAIAVPGTNFTLWYRSDRVPGRGQNLLVRISGEEVPASLKRIEASVVVAGRTYSETFNAEPNQTWQFEWDGLNAYGQKFGQPVPVTVRVDYVYDVQYVVPADAESSFGLTGQEVQALREARVERSFTQRFRGRLGSFDNRPAFGMGGWALDVQTFYDGDDATLVLPDSAAQPSAANVSDLIRTFTIWPSPDGNQIFDMFALSDGRVALVSGIGLGLRKVFLMDQSGAVTEVGGSQMAEGEFFDECFIGESDCGVGDDPSRWKFVGNVDLGPDDSLYFLNSGCVRRLDLDAGVYENYGGSCDPSQFDQPGLDGINIAACEHGVYAGSSEIIERLSETGEIEIVAGYIDRIAQDYDPETVPGAVATEVYIDSIGSMVCGSEGALYWIDQLGSIIELNAQGRLEVEWANDQSSIGALNLIEANEGGPFMVGREQQTVRLWKADDGSLNVVAGAILQDIIGISDEEEERRLHGDNVPAVDTVFLTLYAVTQFDDGRILIQDTSKDSRQQGDRYREIVDGTPDLDEGLELIDPSGNVLTVYDRVGRPTSMINVRTGVELYRFGYEDERLVSIEDRFARTVEIERDASGNPTAIVGYYGARTELTTDDEGFLTSMRLPDASERTFEVGPQGLMTAYIDGASNRTDYEYSADGGLQRVDHPDGTWKTFEAARRTVTMRTSDGREVVYGNGDAGFSGRTTTDAAGLPWQLTRTIDGTTTTLRPDGVVLTHERSDDPRFGSQARYTSLRQIQQPSGLTSIYEARREADFSPTNLLDVDSTRDILVWNGNEWVAEYDNAARTLTITSPEGRVQTVRYDDLMRIAERSRGFDAVEYTYDDGNLTRLDWGATSIDATHEAGYLQSLTTADGRELRFTRDGVGRVVGVSRGAATRQISRDGQGNPTEFGTPDRWMQQDFDSRNRLSAIRLADDTAFEIGWGIDGRQDSYQAPDIGALDFTYDDAGRIASVGGVQTYTYDETTGRLVTVQNADVRLDFTYDGTLRTGFDTESGGIGGSVQRTFDEFFRVAERTVQAESVSYEYDDDGLTTRAGEASLSWNPNAPLMDSLSVGGVTKTITRDSRGMVSSVRWDSPQGVVFEEAITFDGSLRVDSHRVLEGAAPRDASFAYDDAGNLVQVVDGAAVTDFGFDDAGNRTSADGVAQTYDAAGRLEAVGAIDYTFDAAGRIVSRVGSGFDQSFDFDRFNRLTGANVTGRTIEYGYDALGRLVSKSTNGTLDFVWLYDDMGRPHAQLTSTGALDTLFVYADNASVPTYMERGGQTYVFVTDYLGSVRKVVDTSGNAVQELEYDAWGRVMTDTNPGFQPFAFASGLLDTDTGLMTMGKRHYDPVSGRWVSMDPTGAGGGLNPWVYANNAPTTFVDPDGELAFVPALIIVAVAGSGTVALLSVQDTAYSASRDSLRIGQQAGGGDGPVDALRHCTMNCRMTRAYGRSVAELASWYHESPLDADPDNFGSPSNVMDENNNTCGQDIGENAPPDQSCLNACEEALLAGELDILAPADWTHGDATQQTMETQWTQWQADGVRSQRYGPYF